jgi:hypothetical protein
VFATSPLAAFAVQGGAGGLAVAAVGAPSAAGGSLCGGDTEGGGGGLAEQEGGGPIEVEVAAQEYEVRNAEEVAEAAGFYTVEPEPKARSKRKSSSEGAPRVSARALIALQYVENVTGAGKADGSKEPQVPASEPSE